MRLLCLALVCSALVACSDDDPSPAADGGQGDSGHDAGADAGDVEVRIVDRSGLGDVGTQGRLDYGRAEHWLCRPDIEPNECARDLDATEIKPDGTREVIEHVPASRPAFDCFYVYPTVWLNRTSQMTDFSASGVELTLDALLSQGARWTSMCRVFAPLYRQAGMAGISVQPGADKGLALQDVRDAFAHYLEHDSQGRKFVLLGHSQGSFMLSSLISRDIDDNPALRERMISAVLLGGQPYAPPGERVGGSFRNVRACTAKGEVGCVIAYNSFATEAPPTMTSVFGRVGTELANEAVDTSGQVFCVDPRPLAGNAERFSGSYFPQLRYNKALPAPTPVAGIETPFVLYRNLLSASCATKDGARYLEISADRPADDVREMPTYRDSLLEAVGFGLHVVDYNLALEDLMKAVELQAAAATR